MTARPRRGGAATSGAVAVTFSALLLTGCASSVPTATEPTPTAPASAASPTPEESTNEPTAAPLPDVAVGDVVEAALVDALREAGHAIYVSPRGDRSGLVVDPAADIPQIVLDDLAAVPDLADVEAMIDPAATPSQRTIAREPLQREANETRIAAYEAVQVAGFRLFIVRPGVSLNTFERVGWGGGFIVPDWDETRDLNGRLHTALTEHVPVGQARLDNWDRITASPEAFIDASREFRDAHPPAQVIILRK